MNRTVPNIIIDLIAAVLFIGMIATGYLLRFPLPPGTNKSLALWGLTRHQWGDIHFWISLGLLAVLLVHLVLHWNWIVTVIGKRRRQTKSSHPSLVCSGAWTLGIVATMFIVFGWFAQRDVKEIDRYNPALAASTVTNKAQKPDPASHRVTEDQAGQLVWTDVYPILERRCLDCHGPHRQSGGFRIDRRDDYFKDANRSPLILPGHADKSLLIDIISGLRTDMAKAEKHKLTEPEIVHIKIWIDQGAKWPEKPVPE